MTRPQIYEWRQRFLAEHRGTQSQWPVGRLVPLKPDYDSSSHLIQAHVPSGSRDNRVYLVSLNCETAECICGCEAYEYRVSALKNRGELGVFLEHTEHPNGKPWWPLITRNPSGLCPHLRKLRLWLKAHKIYQHIENVVRIHEERMVKVA